MGKNVELIKNGVNGVLADSSQDWLKAFITLFDSLDLRKQMGMQGRLLIEKHYSLQSMTEPYTKFIKSCERNVHAQPNNQSNIL